jgi:hypothetical protein
MAKVSSSPSGGSIAAGGAVPVLPPWLVGGAGAAGAGSRLNWHNGKFGLNHYTTKDYVKKESTRHCRRRVRGHVGVAIKVTKMTRITFSQSFGSTFKIVLSLYVSIW